MTVAADRDYEQRGYGRIPVGFGEKPGIVVIDYQIPYTKHGYPLAGAPLVDRAVENTARLLKVARQANVPVANCYVAYGNEREIPYWKVDLVRKMAYHSNEEWTKLDERIYDPDYDMLVCKTTASIFFNTNVGPFFTKERVDTVIVTGVITSGCIRASAVDSFALGYRTIVPEDCVGDHDEQAHRDNLRDLNRRYADISSADEVIGYIEQWRARNSS